MNPLALAGGRVAILLIATGLLAGSATINDQQVAPATSRNASVDWPRPAVNPPVPAALTDAGMSLRAPPVAVPIELRLPTLNQQISVLGVGILPNNVMDAPMGPAASPVWQQAFWYRGSAVPGEASLAVIAGHISDPLGRPGVFANLGLLRPSDPVVVHDNRDGLDVQFVVTDVKSYPIELTNDPAVLREIYGAGPVAGTWAQPSADGRAYLTLVTCDGTFRNGTHDHRLVVHAVRVN
ncbi:MAG: class F sortase [Acidimicrobiia bacterium]